MQFFSPFRVVVLFFVLGLLGLATLPRLSVDLNPSTQKPILQIRFQLPQAAPELVEFQVTSILENTLSQLSGIRKIESQSSYNSGSITLHFDANSPMDQRQMEAAALIRRVYSNLPKGTSYPQLQRYEERGKRAKALLVYTLSGPHDSYTLRQTASELLQKRFAQNNGVKEVTLSGAEELQVKLSYDLVRLQAYGLSSHDLTQALQSASNASISGMFNDGQGRALYLSQARQAFDRPSLERLVIKSQNHRSVRLADVANWQIEEQPLSNYYRINGLSTITLAIMPYEGQNTLVLGQALKKLGNELAEQLPEHYALTLAVDETEFVRDELNKIYWRSGLSVLILLLFVWAVSRSSRYLLALFTGIIINLLITALALWALDISIHLYTLAGLTISFGLIVDNAIVMLDHLHKKKKRQVFLALLAASLTTMAALGLVLFLPEEERLNLTEFALVIILNLAVSLLVALLFTPAIHSLLYNKSTTKSAPRWRQLRRKLRYLKWYQAFLIFSVKKRKWIITAMILTVGLPVFMLPSKWENQAWYNASIGSDFYQELLRPYVDKALGGTLRLFVRHAYERSGFRSNEKTELYVNAEMPFGTRLQAMNQVMQEVESYLKSIEGIDQFITQVYSGEHASIRIVFKKEYENGALPYQLKSKLTVRSLDWGGVGWSIYGVGRGFSNQSGEGLANFRVKMMGYNYEELERQAQLLADKLLVHKRIQKVNINERLSYNEKSGQEYVLTFNLEAMARQQLSAQALAEHYKSQTERSFSGTYAVMDNNWLPIYLAENKSEQFDRYRLLHNVQALADTVIFKTPQVAGLQLEKTSSSIYKENRQYIRMIGFDYYGSARFGNQYLDEKLLEMKQEMPIGYSAEKQFWSWGSDKVKRQYGLLLLLMLAIFFICSVLFESFRLPFFIMLIIPLSFVGIFLVFGWLAYYFDQGGYAAFVLLGGIVVNAAIFIVHEMTHLKGNTLRKVSKAIQHKSVPIVLTIFSTCLGLIPFLLQGDTEVFWFSLAAGTIGGLLFSLVLIFWFLPVLLIRKKQLA